MNRAALVRKPKWSTSRAGLTLFQTWPTWPVCWFNFSRWCLFFGCLGGRGFPKPPVGCVVFWAIPTHPLLSTSKSTNQPGRIKNNQPTDGPSDRPLAPSMNLIDLLQLEILDPCPCKPVRSRKAPWIKQPACNLHCTNLRPMRTH